MSLPEVVGEGPRLSSGLVEKREKFAAFGLFRCLGCGVESGEFLHGDCLTRQCVCSPCFAKGVRLPPRERSRLGSSGKTGVPAAGHVAPAS